MDDDNKFSDVKTPEVRSPAGTLMFALQDIEETPADRLVVIYTNANGDLSWSSSGPYSYSHIVGMLECVKAKLLAKFCREDGYTSETGVLKKPTVM